MVPALPLVADPRVRAFRALVDVLRSDPTLKRLGIDWVVWDGTVGADREPTKGRIWVRLTPSLDPSEPIAAPGFLTRLVESNVTVKVETHIPGNWNWDDPVNLWGAIEAALYPPADRRPEVMRRRKADGLMDVLTLQPAADVGPDAVSAGKLQLIVYVPG